MPSIRLQLNPSSYPPTHLPTYPPTHLPIHPPTHPPTYPPTHPPSMPTPEIQWYPGHIAKAEKALLEQLKRVDVVLEVRDARIPLATHHPQMQD